MYESSSFVNFLYKWYITCYAGYTLSIEIMLPVYKSLHKNTGKLAFDHCQITDPDPAHTGFHPGFSRDYINSFSVGQISRSQIAVWGGYILILWG